MNGITNGDVGTLGLIGAVGGAYGVGGYGYGRGYDGIGHHFLAEQNKEINRDVNKGFCESDKATAAGFSFQNLNEANRNGQTRELIIEQNQSVKDSVAAQARFIEQSVLSNERLTTQALANLTAQNAALTNSFERRNDMVDMKLCAIDKEQAVAAALATERNAALNHKLDSITHRFEADDAFARQLAKFQAVNGCQPALSPCGQ